MLRQLVFNGLPMTPGGQLVTRVLTHAPTYLQLREHVAFQGVIVAVLVEPRRNGRAVAEVDHAVRPNVQVVGIAVAQADRASVTGPFNPSAVLPTTFPRLCASSPCKNV